MNKEFLKQGVARRTFMRATAGFAAMAATPRISSARAESVTLNILNSNVAWSGALTGSVAEAYRAATGVAVTGETNPYESHYDKMLIELSQGSDTFDIVTSDSIWVQQPIRNGWAANLDEMRAKNPALPALRMENLASEASIYTAYNDQRFGLPLVMTTPVFVYRKDLFEQAGVEKVPTNWDEYREAAKKLHSGEVAGNAMLLGGVDSLTTGEWGSRIMGMVKLGPSDDYLLTPDNAPAFNSEGQGERAIERLRELVEYCPQGVQGFDYPEGSSMLQQGKAAMLVTWSDVIVGIEDGPHKGKFGYTVAPTEKFEQQQVGGWSIVANARSRNVEEAYKFLAWMTEGRAYELFREGGESSLCLKRDIDNPDITKSVPMMQAFKDFALRGTSSVALPAYRLTNAVEVQRVLFEEVVAGVSGSKTPKQAMADAYDRIAKTVKG
jgi:ABC-type glycerol-3-phosphate transport system substrate-binding protein